jgi:hypothetical protein
MSDFLHLPISSFLRPDSTREQTVSRYKGLRDGGGEWVELPSLTLQHATTSPAPFESVEMTFSKDGGSVEADIATLGLAENWKDIRSLTAEIQNGDSPCLLTFTLVCARGRLIETRELQPGERMEILLDVTDMPLAQGIQPPWSPSALRFSAQWGDTWQDEGVLCIHDNLWPQTQNNSPISLTLLSLGAQKRDGENITPVVDRFGQRLSAEWPNKVHSEADLEQNRTREINESPVFTPEQLSPFGGRRDLPRHQATGFFRTEEMDGKWWFIDPQGYLFWSVGTTGVRLLDSTVVEGREDLFAELPDPDGPHADVINPPINSPANDPQGKKAVAFYAWNVLRKYGNFDAWRDQVLTRFRSWGFNSLGNWSELARFGQSAFPFTISLSTHCPGIPNLKGNLPDLAHPDWEAAFTRHVEDELGPYRENPYVLGIFVDNEMGWRGLPEAEQADYAERYFSSVRRILKKVSPNHLYLGCRFVRKRPSEIVCKTAGTYCDVVTVNSYDLWPRREQFQEWHQLTGRPILLGEFHTPEKSAKQLEPLYPAFTPEQRSQLYTELVQKWAEQPWSLGCHWYQHADQHITGRPVDGENQPVGVVDITDTPNVALINAVRAATANMYAWHQDSSAE